MDPDLPPTLATGLPGLDAANQQLLETLDRLVLLDEAGFPAAYSALVELVERDFRHEETLMESIDYPAEREHLEQHARVLGGLHRAEAALLRGDSAPAHRCIQLLPKWLELHIATQDAPLALAAELASAPDHLP